MVYGRELYRQLADKSGANARELFLDALALKKRGSRGHAIAFSILAMEESAKAYMYRLAAEGVIRIVKGKPNNVTTFRESDFLKHPFKHAIITNELADMLNYAPFYQVISDISKGRPRKAEIKAKMVRAINSHRRMTIELRSGGPASKEVKRLFDLLESLNQKKNDGLYVGHGDEQISEPNNTAKNDLSEVLDLAETVVAFFSQFAQGAIDPKEKKVLLDEMRKTARHVKRIERRIANSTPKANKM
jgi:AbiV family abortive infection protein